ncbi:YeeE/YedE thiosulfate transporter family protein [Roseateles toxinivorans]|uniref:Uncharacterized protein n=1 Tax=Roseateles toxinivorans TaxID=270368 RepID=A0A4V3CT82_9BURK|nr:YeeE/YedE thiosulfate transporter family protein [Roseateles toxinivorans]TDP64164.1 hypothetical protein DES47_104453 [Roseateles toxinivorans]
MQKPIESCEPRPFWPNWLAGVVLGLVLLLTFVWTGHGLGATGASTRLTAALAHGVAPAATEANGYLGPMVKDGNPLPSWISWQVLGVAIGALLAAWQAGRLRVQLDGERSVGRGRRLLLALGGGIVAGFGARVAAGCTSGLGLSGAASLGVSAFVFLGTFFAVGIVASRLLRGV